MDLEFPVNLPIRMLKIDVEGFELKYSAARRGSSRVIASTSIMMECLQEVSGGNWEDLLVEVKKLIDIGYGPIS